MKTLLKLISLLFLVWGCEKEQVCYQYRLQETTIYICSPDTIDIITAPAIMDEICVGSEKELDEWIIWNTRHETTLFECGMSYNGVFYPGLCGREIIRNLILWR